MGTPQTNHSPTRRVALRVRGVVQGVGFRPTVFRLATEENLTGHIGNDSAGVFIELEGPNEKIENFLTRIRTEAPPLARIDSVELSELAPLNNPDEKFSIAPSHDLGSALTGIPADAATCEDCRSELFSPIDRRYRYPFLNCTNCGPRFTITRHIPYDRPQTSMAVFPMCSACQREYDSPLDRRFHAQPNACPVCGPRLSLVDSSNAPIPYNAIDEAAATIELLLQGKIVAIKGIGGFHLAVDPRNEAAVARLRERKHRYGKALAIMVPNIKAARLLAEITPTEEAALLTPARPIVLLRAKSQTPLAAKLAPSVAPNLPWLGLFLPYAPLHHLLLADPRLPMLVMTSANLSEEPIAIDNIEARARLAYIADAFLIHNRDILQRADDSVLQIAEGAPQIIRRARGFVPLSIPLPIDSPPLLAVGGHLKNVFTLARGHHAYQSQHMGDLENLTGLNFFEEALAHLKAVFSIEPTIIAHDLHPNYLSTEWALAQPQPKIAIQHHHAHIAACLAENNYADPHNNQVIGLALDGTGYGPDGNIWGGEALIASLTTFTRFAHLAYAPMPGSSAAIKEPRRMALGSLISSGIELTPSLITRLGFNPKEEKLMRQMIDKKINTPLTSSCGRLFDAVAALVLSRHTVHYEAQAAVELEGICSDDTREPGYDFELITAKNPAAETIALSESSAPLQLSPAPMWLQLLQDLDRNVDQQTISARFHSGLAAAWTRVAVAARTQTGLSAIALSGGCFHNRLLLKLLQRALIAEGFRVLTHAQVSPGDGGLSYGQVAIAAALLNQ